MHKPDATISATSTDRWVYNVTLLHLRSLSSGTNAGQKLRMIARAPFEHEWDVRARDKFRPEIFAGRISNAGASTCSATIWHFHYAQRTDPARSPTRVEKASCRIKSRILFLSSRGTSSEMFQVVVIEKERRDARQILATRVELCMRFLKLWSKERRNESYFTKRVTMTFETPRLIDNQSTR